ncbi:MAG: hypothetical protein LWX56_02715 [Ignavibacteria bacterium]|nr:hypothetical protein [Ignavibacteria bacterium]
MRNLRAIALVLTIFSTCIQAQSLYSMFGLGLVQTTGSARGAALGSNGLTLTDADFINVANPAALSFLDITRLNAGLQTNAMFAADQYVNKYYSRVDFSGVSFAFPIYHPYGLSLAMGIEPVSIIKYQVRKTFSDTVFGAYSKDFDGSGGLSKFAFSLSYALPLDFRLGFTYNYYFGQTDIRTAMNFTSSTMGSGEYATKYDIDGNGYQFAVISPDIARYFGDPLTHMRVSASVDLSSTLPATYSEVSITSYNSNYVINTSKLDFELPAKYQAGFSATLKNGLDVYVQYLSQAWSKYKVGGVADNNLQDQYRLSLGFALLGARADYGSDRSVYRFGVSYEQTPVKYNNTSVQEYGIHFGTGIPLSKGSNIETTLSYLARGKKSNGLIQENIIRLDATVNLGEIWFIQSER